jgi:hypothetical protein
MIPSHFFRLRRPGVFRLDSIMRGTCSGSAMSIGACSGLGRAAVPPGKANQSEFLGRMLLFRGATPQASQTTASFKRSSDLGIISVILPLRAIVVDLQKPRNRAFRDESVNGVKPSRQTSVKLREPRAKAARLRACAVALLHPAWNYSASIRCRLDCGSGIVLSTIGFVESSFFKCVF